MAFDPLTLITASLIVAGATGGLLLLSWLQNREVVALAWWSGAFLLAAIGFVLLLLGAVSAHSLVRELANAIIATGYGMSYAASRQFNGRSIPWIAVFAGGIIWLIACWGVGITTAERMIFASLLIGSYTFATAYELWFGARERLVAQRAAALLCFAHGFYFVLRLVIGPTLMPSKPWVENVGSTWGTVMAVETLIYVTSFGSLIMSMAKEQLEHRHRRAARQDPLTGVSNRRAFQEEAERLLAANCRQERASSVVLFDLDHFKAINDSHGHDAGDRVLLAFCDTASKLVGKHAIFCRMGGEEFAAFLSTNSDDALTIAERIRTSFADRTIMVDQQRIRATVSAGIATTVDSHLSLRELLAHADAALYRAKSSGRNQVVAESLLQAGAALDSAA